jgi:PAS domain S-box-containing protein
MRYKVNDADAGGFAGTNSGRMADTAEGGQGEASPPVRLRPLRDLADTARLLSAVLATARDQYYLLDRDKRFRFASASALRALRVPPERLVGRTWQEAGLPAAVLTAVEGEFDRVLRSGKGRIAEAEYPTAKGARLFEYQIDPIRDEDQTLAGLLVAARDITERHRTETVLREREERLRAVMAQAERERQRLDLILNSVSEAITAVFLDTGTTVRNQAWLRFHGFASFAELPGWQLDEVAPLFEVRDLEGRLLPLDEVPMSRAMRGEAFADLEVELRRKDNGRVWWGSYNGAALRGPDGRVAAALISMRDTTERKRAQDELRALVEQRDRLLLELNHRVKNNLQIVAGLLKIQGARGGNPAAARLFEQAGQRVAAIAQVHATLYQGDMVGSLEFAGYLRDLCHRLAQSFPEATEGRVALAVEAEEARLKLDQAVPLGLIVNELVTNAFKHGFAQGAAGTVHVRFRGAGGGRWRLEVADDGGAIVTEPEAGAPAPGGGLGVQLVQGFARQLGGTARFERAPRFRVRVEFPR